MNALQILFFYECIAHVIRTHYRCEKFVRVLHRSEGFASSCHICEIITRILHRCDKYLRIFHTCVRFVWLFLSNESVIHVKNSHVFVTYVKNSNEFFTGVTNTYEFFTCLKLDIVKNSFYYNRNTGGTYISHIPKCDVFVRIIHSVWKIRSVNIKVQQSPNKTHDFVLSEF